MNKKLIKIAILLFLCFGLFITVGCENEECDHDYELIAKVEATDCEHPGHAEYKCKECGREYIEKLVIPHDVENDEDYISLQECATCHKTVRNTSLDIVNEYFYNKDLDELLENFNDELEDVYDELEEAESKKTKIGKKIAAIKVNLEFSEMINAYYEVRDQQTYDEIAFYVENNEETTKAKEASSELMTTVQEKYRSLYYDMFYSNLKEILFEGEDLEALAKQIENYQNPRIKELDDQINKACDDLYFSDEDLSVAEFATEYAKIVALRQELAKLYNHDNYYEYMHSDGYGRAYSVDNIVDFRNYVASNLKTTYLKLSSSVASMSNAQYMTVNAYLYQPMFNNATTTGAYVDYLKKISSDELPAYDMVNEAFKDGRVYLSTDDGVEAGFTTSIYYDSVNVMYFYNGEYYAAPSTVVHETGHFLFSDYYDYNDYDLFEVQSQTNEQLFYKYLKDNKTNADAVSTYATYSALSTIFTVSIVDEFEYAIYTNYSDLDESFKDGIDASEYTSLYNAICNRFGYKSSHEQWEYYCTQSSCYEISYAISLIPTLCKGIDAQTDFNASKDDYTKLINFPYYKDNKNKTLTFLEALAYANFDSPFEESSFEKIAQYYSK